MNDAALLLLLLVMLKLSRPAERAGSSLMLAALPMLPA
jgi:hypothetical protein